MCVYAISLSSLDFVDYVVHKMLPMVTLHCSKFRMFGGITCSVMLLFVRDLLITVYAYVSEYPILVRLETEGR